MITIIKILYGIIFLLLFASCKSNDSDDRSTFYMPNGEVVNNSSVQSWETAYKLKFEQYEGFIGNYNDTILQKFTLLLEDHAHKVGHDVLNDERIENLKKAKVIAIEFGVPEKQITFQDLVKYLQLKYPRTTNEQTTVTETGVKNEIVFRDSLNQIVCRVQYTTLGISGSFVTIYPI